MKIRKLLLTIALSSISITCFAHDIIVENHTNDYATAQAQGTPCSSVIGDKGILKPHENMKIYQIVEDLYCKHNCDVEIFVSKNCSGKSVASAHLDYKNGVTSSSSHTDAYKIVGSGYDVALEGRPAKKSWFNFLFG